MSRGLPQAAALRARRWDVVMLGGALPGLAAAIRLAMGGLRVLVVEEEVSAKTPDFVREPFFLPGGFGDGIVDACLRSLGIPVIDRRELVASDLAYQVLLPDARIDVGNAHVTGAELVAWALAKPDLAPELMRRLAEAARAEGEALLAADPARAHALRAGKRPALQVAARGLPAGMRDLAPPLARFFELQTRGLSNLAAATPPPEALARLLGSALLGGTSLADSHGGIRALLRRRLATLHAEFRSLSGSFQFVEVGEHPGIAREQPADVWIGRAVVLNAPVAKLAEVQRAWGYEVPHFLDGPAPTARRVTLHLRALAEAIPEPLAPRALLASDAVPGGVALSVLPSPRGARFAELIARAVGPDDAESEPALALNIRSALGALLPEGDARIVAAPLAGRPRWDDDAALVDPERGVSLSGTLQLRTGGRRPVFRLPREAGAALGVEGDLLLGCQAGDAVRGELG
ncbi:MAG: hypothetical protein ACHQ6V_10660 [Myxococcota bacterium]